jgi:type III pantothenate kinase
MLLAVDVGNTTINAGIFEGKRLVYAKKLLTKKPASRKYYSTEFKKILKNKRVDNVIISSVVPDTTKALKAVFRNNFHIRPIVLGEGLIVPIKNLYKNPKQVGQDRLVNAYAGYKKFGGRLIIVDFGTAVTFDVVSKKGEYLGGIIMPGIETSLKTLSEKAALLPKIKITNVKTLIGRDTKTSMLSGILHGYGALCDGLASRIKKEVGQGYKVILTGGHAKVISKYCRFYSIQPNLTLEGLRDVFKIRFRCVPGCGKMGQV